MTTVRDVELAKVGHWDTLTGTWSPTAADLQAAVDAHQARVLRRPVVKLGHTDPRFDGEPAFGHIDNLRVDGETLLGDLVGVPAWLAAAMPTHYPDRSVEALCDFAGPDGRTWPLVLTAVALLGAERPAVTTLASLQELVTASAGRGRLVVARLTPADRHRRTIVVAAAARRRRLNR
ncbi:hypothetical protein [Gordonia sp. NPDC003429]